MKKRFSLLAACLATASFGAGCAEVQSRWASRDGHKKYQEEDYRGAIEDYERALSFKGDQPIARFYLGSAHQALYRPGSTTPDNRAHLEKAIEEFKLSLEQNTGGTDNLKQVRTHAIAALTAIYSEEPYRNFEEAFNYAQRLVNDNPDDSKNLYALANLYEKFNRIDDAEELYRKIVDLNQDDLAACGALAAFLNKPLWEGASKFDEAIGVLHRCADLAPDDPQGFQKVATFYWDKAYRDPVLTPQQRDEYADRGLEAVDKALALKPDLVEALVYKGLLYRVKAQATTSPARSQQLIEEANLLRDRAVELKEQQDEEAAAQAAQAAPPDEG
jgi:tetratricopeptide (TPR) repeat protein